HHQVLEHLVLIAGQVDVMSMNAYRLSVQYEHHRSTLQGRLAPARGPPDQRIDASQQFLDMEWLDEVIVRPLLQALDLVLPAGAGGQDQDREALVLVAQRLDQLHARHLGQAEVDDAEVEGDLATHVQPFFAVLSSIHREAFALEPGCERLAQRGFDFHQQDTHGHSSDMNSLNRDPNRTVAPQLSSLRIRRVPWLPTGSSRYTRTR